MLFADAHLYSQSEGTFLILAQFGYFLRFLCLALYKFDHKKDASSNVRFEGFNVIGNVDISGTIENVRLIYPKILDRWLRGSLVQRVGQFKT